MKLKKPTQIKKLKALAEEYRIPNDLIDFEAEVDNTLTYEENLKLIQPKLEALKLIDIDKVIKDKQHEFEEVIDIQETQNRLSIEKEATEIFDNHLKLLRKSPVNIDRFFKNQYGVIKALVKNTKVHSLIIEGEAGLGKSWNSKKALKDEKMKVINTYTTPLEFYHLLHEFKEGYVIILDDIPKLFNDDISIGILLSALWEPRIVSYFTTSQKLKCPQQFHFNSKIIILTNQIPNKIEAMLSRSYVFKQKFSYQNKLKMILEYIKMYRIPMELFDFIKENTNESFIVDLRLPDKLNGIYEAYPKAWKHIAKTQLECNPILDWIIKNKAKSVSEQIKDFRETFGLGQRSYYNYRAKLK